MNDDQTYTNPLRKDLKVKLSKSVFDIIFVSRCFSQIF